MNTTGVCRAVIRSVIGAAVVLAAITGCSRGDGGAPMETAPGPTGAALTTPPPPVLPAPFAQVDQDDPIAVMVAGIQAMFSYRPASDSGQADAANRAAPLLDERYYDANVTSFPALVAIPGGQWEQWRAAQARTKTTVTVTADDHPADLPAKVSRVLAVRVDVLGPDQHLIDTVRFAAYTTVTRLGVWRISAVGVR